MALLIEITRKQIEKAAKRPLTKDELESTIKFLENEIEDFIQSLMNDMQDFKE